MISPWHKPGSPQWQAEVQSAVDKKWCWEVNQCSPDTPRNLAAALGVALVIIVLAMIFIKPKK